jgi:hypothetical protein
VQTRIGRFLKNEKGKIMRYIWIHKTDKETEAGVPPTPELIAKMGTLMGEMAQSGVLLAGEGLQPSSMSVRLKFAEGKRTVTHGPLNGLNEILAGFALVRTQSMDEAIEWASRFGTAAKDVEIDIGQVKEPWDLGLCPRPEGQATRFLIMHKAKSGAERNSTVIAHEIDLFRKWTRELAEAGVLLSSEKLEPSSNGVRLRFSGGKSKVFDGPFTEAKELIGGYCIAQVNSKDEGMEWASRFARLLGSSRAEAVVELDILPLYER